MKGVFVGSGSDGMNEKAVVAECVRLTGKASGVVQILYIGTATYDMSAPRERQTARFLERGCKVQALDVAACGPPPPPALGEMFATADIILVSGGNTLFAVDRWKKLKLDKLMHQAMSNGAVMAGGSAGAICWFDGGHSDSMDPDSFKKKMCMTVTDGDESSSTPKEGQEPKQWEYIRVPGLGFLPGLACPHFDKTQSNGVLRAVDFDEMMLRHAGETGICIDHWAALVVEGDSFRVLSLHSREGSVLPSGEFSATREGAPGVWIKEVVNGTVHTRLCAQQGQVKDLCKVASSILKDARVAQCRQLNPDDAPAI
mmetsp:Transcript_17724/g.43395  ORF Transcript_17724/g.43395 Transcript_17724/m.43395 type:complete len:314 (+) Transcript_17724:172-1113(+)